MPLCPPTEELIGLLDNEKSNGVRSPLFEHVDSCSTCRNRLQYLAEVDEKSDDSMAVTSVLPIPGLAGETRTMAAAMAALPTTTSLPEVPGFQILSEIGRGGMGVVYMARQTKLNRTIALKMVLVGPSSDPTTVQRFLFEAEVLARIQHTNVVQVYEVGTYRSYDGSAIPFLVMEYLDGGTLHSYLRKSGPLDPRAAAELIEGLGRAVHAIHSQGVIHRDLKPANILRSDEGAFKVSDFGLAKLTGGGNSELTATGTIVGTPSYMSPEQASGSRTIGTATDVYSLGAILYELLAGRSPYPGPDQVSVLVRILQHDPPDVRSLRPKMPINLAAITMQALARDPAHRYASAEAMADDLRRFLENRPTVARPATLPERLGLWIRRNPVVAALVTGLAAVIVLGMGLVFAEWTRAERNAIREGQAKVEATRALVVAEGQRKKAEQSEAEKNSALLKEQQSLRDAGRREAKLLFQEATNWCDKGEPERGATAFQECLHLARLHGDGELERVAAANRKAWESESIPQLKSIPSVTGSQSVAYSRDGTLLAVGSSGSLMQIHDAVSGRILAVCELSLRHMFDTGRSLSCRFWSVALNADKSLLAAGGSDGRVWLWKLPSLGGNSKSIRIGTIDAWREAKSEDVWSVAFDGAGNLCTACGDGVVRRWNVSNPSHRKPVDELPALPPHPNGENEVQTLIASRDGRRIYTGDRSGRIREWNLLTNEHRVISQSRSWVQDLAISTNGSVLAAAVADGTVRILDLAREDRPRKSEFVIDGIQANSLDFSTDGRYLVVGSGEGNTRVWDVDTELTIGFPIRDGGDTRKIRMRPGTDTFAVATVGSVKVYALPDKQPRKVLLPDAGHDHPIGGITNLAYSPDGRRLLTAAGHEPMIVDVERNVVQRVSQDRDVSFGSVVYASTGDRETVLATASRRLIAFDADLQWISTDKFDELGSLRNPWLVYEPRSGLAIVAKDQRVWSFRPKQKKLSEVFRIPNFAKVTALAANPTRAEVLFAVGRKVYFFDTANGTLNPTTRDAKDDVFAAAYSPDGTRILLGVRNNAGEVRDARTWQSTFEVSHQGAVVAVAWGRNGAVLVTGSRDRTVGIWDATTGLPLGPRLRHPDPITAIAYSPTDDVVATACKSRQSPIVHLLLWAIPDVNSR